MKNRNFLQDIIATKEKEVVALLSDKSLSHTTPRIPDKIFSNALKKDKLAVIAEIKRRSPSKGELSPIADPIEKVREYCQGGAAAISVLTDEKFFGGSLTDLQNISSMLKAEFPSIAVLRKDFIIYPIQLRESVRAGASCVLLIASILKEKLIYHIDEADQLGLETLIEIHNEEDLKYALDAGAKIIGINHRNLETFEIDKTIAERMVSQIVNDTLIVAESGIENAEMAKKLYQTGCHAVLVGEALVRASDPTQLIIEMQER